MLAIATGFFTFLCLFTVIGIASSRHRGVSSDDYLLAGRSVAPWLAGLSAVSTTCSGFMFIGLIGSTWKLGVYAAWFAFGLIAGNYVSWRLIAEPFRARARVTRASTIPQFLALTREGESRSIRRAAGLLILVFLSLYAAAQLNAGSKALEVLLHVPREFGAVIGAAIIVVYCYSGGIRASIWTDAAQSIVMVVAMLLLCAVCLFEIGGPWALLERLAAIDPELATLTPEHAGHWGPSLFVLGWVLTGLGVLGQPHVMIRILTVESAAVVARMRRIYFCYYIPFLLLAIATGLCSRVLIPMEAGFDPEIALPMLAQARLPGLLVGVILAGVFSATVSTADSQVLACSAAVSNDLGLRNESSTPKRRQHTRATLGVTVAVLLAALWAPANIFTLVLFAWGALAAAFAPLMVTQSISGPLTTRWTASIMFAGTATALAWRGFGLGSVVSELLPAFLVALALVVWARRGD